MTIVDKTLKKGREEMNYTRRYCCADARDESNRIEPYVHLFGHLALLNDQVTLTSKTPIDLSSPLV